MAGFRSETKAGVRGAFLGIGKVVGAAIGAVAVGEIVKSSVEASSEIQKQLEVIRFEFGRAGEGLIKFADTVGVTLGDANRYTDIASARFGLLFKSLGVGHAAAARMTLGFEKLALSVNAVRGGGNAGAERLLQSIVLAAAGNTRGLKQMGIVVDSVSEKIAAFKLGLISSMTQALTPAQKTEAIYAIATAHLGQTMALAKAHAGDLANVQARLSAEFMLAKERLGDALLPAMASFVGFLADKLPGAVDVLAAVLKDLRVEFKAVFSFVKPVFEPIVRVIRSVAEAFKGGGGLTGALDRIRDNFAKLSPAAKIAVVALGGIAAAFASITITAFPITSIIVLGAALGEAYRRSSKFRDVVSQIGNVIRGSVVPAFQRFGRALEPVANFLVNKVASAVRAVTDGILHGLGRAFAFVSAHTRVFEVLGAAVAGMAAGFVAVRMAMVAYMAAAKIATAVQIAFDAAMDANPVGIIVLAIAGLVAALTALYFKSATVRRVLHEAFTAIGPVITNLGHTIKNGLVFAFAQATPVAHALGQTLRTFGATAKAAFAAALPVLRTFAHVIGAVVVGAVRVLETVWKHFRGTFIAVAKAAIGNVIAVIKGGLEVLRGIFDFITGLLTLNWRKAWKGITEILGGALHAAVAVVKNWGHVMVAFFTDLWHTIEKIVLKGIEKVVHLLAKIPTGFSVFGHHFGFTNPFQGWDASLKKTIANIGAVKKAAVGAAVNPDSAVRRGLAKAGNDPGTKSVAQATGKKLGDAIGQGAAQGVAGAAPAMQKTLSDTLQRAVAAANTAIQGSVRSAKNNLDKIGQDLAKTITDIQAKLGGAAGALAGSPQGKAFQKLKQLIESGAPAFEIQRARAALSSQLANVGKTTTGSGSQIGTQLANLTAEFNKGQIGYKQFQRRLHEILRKDGFTMAQALKAAGPAIADKLRAELRAMAAQAKAIAAVPKKFRGIGGAGGAADIKIIRPLEVIKREQMRVRVVTQKVQQQAKAAAQKQQALQRSFNQVQIAGVSATRHGVSETKGVRGAVGRGTAAVRGAAARSARSAAAAARVRGHQLIEAKRQTVLQRKIAGERARMEHEHRQVLRAHRTTTRAVQDHHATTRRKPAPPRADRRPARSLMPVINFRPPPLRPIFRLPQAKISPIFRPVIRPILRPTLRPVLPKVQPILRATLRPIVRPVVRIQQAAARPIIRPVLRQPVLRPVFRPVIRQAAVHPIIRPILPRPIIHVQQATTRPAVVRPILRPVIRVQPPPVRPVRPIIHVQQPPVAVGHLAGLVQAAIGRLLPPLEQVRGEVLRLQAVTVAQLATARGGFAHLSAETARFDRQIVAAELRSARPAEGLRRDEARYAAAAARQRETLIRSSERQVTLLRKIAKTTHGPKPGHGNTPHGHGSHAARVHAQTGGRG